MAANAADPQPLAAVTLKKKWQLSTSALLVTQAGWKLGAVWLWATDKHVGAQLVREPHTSIMAAARYIVVYLPDLGLLRAYSASQKLISSMGGRRKTS